MHLHASRLSVASALLPVMGQGPGRPPRGPKTVAGQKRLMSMFAKEGGGFVPSRQALDAAALLAAETVSLSRAIPG